MKKIQFLLLVLIVFLLAGCGPEISKGNFQTLLQGEPNREEVIQTMGEPLKSQGNDWPITIDQYPAAVAVYDNTGSLLSFQTFTWVANSRDLSNLWAEYMRLSYVKALYIEALNNNQKSVPKGMKEQIKRQALNSAKEAKLYAKQFSAAAGVDSIPGSISVAAQSIHDPWIHRKINANLEASREFMKVHFKLKNVAETWNNLPQ